MWTIFATSFVLALSGALMPGPMLTFTIAESAKIGWKAGPTVIVGHAILEAALVLAVLGGLAPLLQDHRLQFTISVLGSGILLWMSVGMLRGVSRLTLPATRQKDFASSVPDLVQPPFKLRLLGAGILLSLSNPYWIMWWVTVGLGFLISAQLMGAIGVIVFYAGHILADLAWYCCVSMAIDRGKRWINDFAYRCLVVVCALFLVGTALWLGHEGLAGFWALR